MMAQCFSGAFANLIYEGGDPEGPVALQTRCGFFATVETRPSVGCTPLVNEADYEDYSSSFFAGLSGRDRVGNPAPSADYDQDGQVTYAEAHAFTKWMRSPLTGRFPPRRHGSSGKPLTRRC
ncbi:MAG: hypothetical protein HC812_06460 [Leptolyngbya sp. RL_3_1]|nr:hypothetical protein [Leptolyngbya sp. RL_3_1]